jgi:lysozyme family protein
MSDFLKAYQRTMRNEGGYSNNPRDRGGETVYGISRNNWSKWSGWRIVDNTKDTVVAASPYGTAAYFAWVNHFNGLLAALPNLQLLVQMFYRDNFWKRLGEITDQRVAEECFDKAVNCGEIAYKWLQRAVNVADDGIVGSGTIAAVNLLGPTTVLTQFNEQAKSYYEKIIEHDPTQEVFLKTWLARLKNYDGSTYTA